MSDPDIRDAIITRRFELNTGGHVDAYIWKPFEDISPPGAFWKCEFRIDGLGETKTRYMGGEDSVQALLLAIQSVSFEVYTSEAYETGALTYLGERDLGFEMWDGWKPEANRYEKADVLTPAVNYAVVQLPGRRFPGVIFQGDSLDNLIQNLSEVAQSLSAAEASEKLAFIIEGLTNTRNYYEATCRINEIPLPYKK